MAVYRVNIQVLHSFELDAADEDEAVDLVMNFTPQQWSECAYDTTVEEVEEISDQCQLWD